MPGYVETDLIQARKPITDPAGRDLAFCTLGHLEAEQREAATTDRAEAIRALQLNIATFDGVELEAEDVLTDPAPDPEPTAGGQPPAPLPTPPTPPPAPAATDTRELGRASMLRTLARAGITPVGGQQAPVGASGGISAATSSMHRTLARMGVHPAREA